MVKKNKCVICKKIVGENSMFGMNKEKGLIFFHEECLQLWYDPFLQILYQKC